ncbi:MAG: hypothetical protein IJY78_04465, partial [Bacteroidaceae bacterium]|nr:hypothetical protein [Bacteroidaceae bacterium]
MKTSKKGLLSLIGAILVFTTVSVCFSNCSSEDDFGEIEEMEYTMASKKMTRAGESGSGGTSTLPRQKTSTIEFFCNPDGHSIPGNYESVLDSIINNELTFINPNFGDAVMSFYTQYITSYKIT